MENLSELLKQTHFCLLDLTIQNYNNLEEPEFDIVRLITMIEIVYKKLYKNSELEQYKNILDNCATR